MGISDLVSFHSLEDGADIWADEVENSLVYERRDRCEAVREAGFDVREQAKRLEELYLTGVLR